jgi:hypothetical protein
MNRIKARIIGCITSDDILLMVLTIMTKTRIIIKITINAITIIVFTIIKLKIGANQ